MKRTEGDLGDLTQDQSRIRSNIESLNNVSGQQELVQQYARQLASNETRLAALRDSGSQLRHQKTALESELNSLMEKTDF
jgi:chromosome segregation ATPase